MAKPLLEELVFGDWSKEEDSHADGDVLTGDLQTDGDAATSNVADAGGTRQVYPLSSYCSAKHSVILQYCFSSNT